MEVSGKTHNCGCKDHCFMMRWQQWPTCCMQPQHGGTAGVWLSAVDYGPIDSSKISEPTFKCLSRQCNLFKAVLENLGHVLHRCLPSIRTTPYAHKCIGHIIPLADNLERKSTLSRMLCFKMTCTPKCGYAVS